MTIRLARQFVKRSDVQGYTGKRRDEAAVEFFVGAYSALHENANPCAELIGLFLMLIAPRGFKELTNTLEKANA